MQPIHSKPLSPASLQPQKPCCPNPKPLAQAQFLQAQARHSKTIGSRWPTRQPQTYTNKTKLNETTQETNTQRKWRSQTPGPHTVTSCLPSANPQPKARLAGPGRRARSCWPSPGDGLIGSFAPFDTYLLLLGMWCVQIDLLSREFPHFAGLNMQNAGNCPNPLSESRIRPTPEPQCLFTSFRVWGSDVMRGVGTLRQDK